MTVITSPVCPVCGKGFEAHGTPEQNQRREALAARLTKWGLK